jgi:hypothetical protein
VPINQGNSWRSRAVLAGLLGAFCALAAPASADGGHLPGFSGADQRVAIADLPGTVGFMFGGIPGAKGTGLPHVGHGPVWFGEVKRPKGTIFVAGNGRWVCGAENRVGDSGGSSSCTTPAGARELGVFDVSACGKGPPRHFRVYALVPDGVSAFEIEKSGGQIGRTVPVIENTVAFTIGREDVVMRAIGDATAAGLERTLPLALSAKRFHGGDRAGCTTFSFFETPEPSEAGRAP